MISPVRLLRPRASSKRVQVSRAARLRKLLWTFVQIEKVFRKVFRLLRRDAHAFHAASRKPSRWNFYRDLAPYFRHSRGRKVTANRIISFPYRLLIKYLLRLLLRLLIRKYFLVLIECYFRAKIMDDNYLQLFAATFWLVYFSRLR